MLDEGLYRLPLSVGKMAVIILDALEVSHVCEELLRISQIFVYIIEVTQKDVSPEDELIKGLRFRIQLGIALVQSDKKRHSVCH